MLMSAKARVDKSQAVRLEWAAAPRFAYSEIE
jgi:hypothetical protein